MTTLELLTKEINTQQFIIITSTKAFMHCLEAAKKNNATDKNIIDLIAQYNSGKISFSDRLGIIDQKAQEVIDTAGCTPQIQQKLYEIKAAIKCLQSNLETFKEYVQLITTDFQQKNLLPENMIDEVIHSVQALLISFGYFDYMQEKVKNCSSVGSTVFIADQ